MRSNAPTISQLRLQRFHRWAMLWLRWFMGFLDGAAAFAPLSGQANAIGHAWLDRIERIVLGIAMHRAAPLMVILPRKHSEHRRNDSQRRRAFLGSALRRSLRSKDLRQRIEALSQDIERLVAHFLKRLPHGLTRRRPILQRPESRAALYMTPALEARRVADTS